MTYEQNQAVKVQLPAGWYTGRVTKVVPHYPPSGETRFEIQGSTPTDFVTLAPARLIRAI